MQIEVNKEYITKNGFITQIRIIENNLAYASILGTLIDDSERRRIYLLDGKDANNEAFDLEREYPDSYNWETKDRFQETFYRNRMREEILDNTSDLPKRSELMPDVLFPDYERQEKTLPKAFEMKYEEENKSVVSKFMQEFMQYLQEHDKNIHQPDDRFKTEPELPELQNEVDLSKPTDQQIQSPVRHELKRYPLRRLSDEELEQMRKNIEEDT